MEITVLALKKNTGKKVNYRVSNRTGETIELVIINNRIYIKNQRLCSDLILVKEKNINMVNMTRKNPIEGMSFRGEVMKVNRKYQTRVRFIDIEDDYQQDKAHWFPIDQIYSGAFIAPQVGDTVDIYFKAKNEKYASLKSSTTDEDRVIDHDPADKMIRTPGGYRIKLNNEELLFASKGDTSTMNLKKEEIALKSNGSRIKLDPEKVALNCGKSSTLVSSDKIQIAHGNKGIKIRKGKVNIS